MVTVRNLKILYITAGGKRKINNIINALQNRYDRVTVTGLVLRCITFYRSQDRQIRKYSFRLPRLPKHLFFLNIMLVIVFLSTVKFRRDRFDIYIGGGILFTMIGIILKKLGIVKKVVYYAQDWFPDSEKVSVVAFVSIRLSHLLDRICVNFSDVTWNYTKKIVEARLQRWKVPGDVKRWDTIMFPLFAPRNQSLLKKKFQGKPKSVCYVSSIIGKNTGLDLAIRTISNLKEKGIHITLEVIGLFASKSILFDLVKISKDYNVSSQVRFHGWVDSNDLINILQRCICGLALFSGENKNYSNYAIPTKVIEYLENALPVVITEGNPMAEEIAKYKAGIVINFSLDSLSNALYLLATDVHLTETYAQNAYNYACKKASPNLLYDAIEQVVCGYKGSANERIAI